MAANWYDICNSFEKLWTVSFKWLDIKNGAYISDEDKDAISIKYDLKQGAAFSNDTLILSEKNRG